MVSYCYMHVELKLRDLTDVVLTPAYFQGSIENSLHSLFGEFGSQINLELVNFDRINRRAIIKVPEEYATRASIAIILIGHFQETHCHFQLQYTSKKLPNI